MIKKYDICIILDDIASDFARLSVLLWRNINNAKIITDMKQIFLSLMLTAATLPWATAALAQQDPSEIPATRPVNPVFAPQKLIFVPGFPYEIRVK